MVDFPKDTFESVHRRKKLAAWLLTLRGPAAPAPLPVDLGKWAQECAELQNVALLNINAGRSQNYVPSSAFDAGFFRSIGILRW